MIRCVSRSLVIVLFLSLMACTPSGQGTTHLNATPTGTPTATNPADPCPVTVGFIPALPEAHRFFPSSGPIGDSVALYGIAMVSASEGWAVGQRDAGFKPAGGLILHYQQGQWTPVSSPTQEPLWAIAMVSASEGWAVGDTGGILHYSAGRWTVAVSPGSLPDVISLRGISMVSASEGWAVGTGRDPQLGGVGIFVHYAQGQWAEVDPNTVPFLAGADFLGISMASTTDGWAVGSGLLAHDQQGQWQGDSAEESAPDWQHTQWWGISMESATEGWAAGTALGSGGAHGSLAHYCGGRWQVVTVNQVHQLFSVSMLAPGEGWAGGGVILHLMQGQWTPQTDLLIGACNVYGLSMVSATEGWAIGTCNGLTHPNAFLLHYQHGVWSVYQS